MDQLLMITLFTPYQMLYRRQRPPVICKSPYLILDTENFLQFFSLVFLKLWICLRYMSKRIMHRSPIPLFWWFSSFYFLKKKRGIPLFKLAFSRDFVTKKHKMQ